MSGVRVLVGTRKGAFILTSDGKREKWESAAPTLPAGRFITSKDRPPIRTGFTRRSPAAGSGRSFNAPTTAARRGTNPERRRRTDHHAGGHAQGREQQVRLRYVVRNRQAAHDAPMVRRHAASRGSSSESGISNRR